MNVGRLGGYIVWVEIIINSQIFLCAFFHSDPRTNIMSEVLAMYSRILMAGPYGASP